MNDDITAMTLEELTLYLENEDTRVFRAERKYNSESSAYEARLAGAESEAIRSAYEETDGPAFRELEAEVEAIAASVETTVRAIHKLTGKSHPTLRDDEWEAAERRREIIREYSETLRLPELRDRVREAVLTNDRPAMFHFHNYVPGRLKVANRSIQHEEERRDIQQLVSVIQDKLRTATFEPINKRAMEVIVNSGDLRRKAGARRMNAERARNAYSFQSDTNVPWTKPNR